MRNTRVVIVGAGVGGLACAIDLARQGLEVLVLERATQPGGKLREIPLQGQGAHVDAGPTVFTMRWVFDELFAAAGADFGQAVPLSPAEIIARHAWSAAERLDLYAEPARSADAIGQFAGPKEARGFVDFMARARRVYRTLERPFIRAGRPTPLSLVRQAGLSGLADLMRIAPFASLWSVTGEYFSDPRLRQLFGRYATYCGSSPFLAPATLMLVAHVEQEGVWLIHGGMHRIATAMAALAARCGAQLRCGAEVQSIVLANNRVAGVQLAEGEVLEADAVVLNGELAALSSGRLGAEAARAVARPSPAARSLSALTWAMQARTRGFPLVRHCVFFSKDYPAEFKALFRDRRLPQAPTVYVCAQDRGGSDSGADAPAPGAGPERLLCLVNAPAVGDGPGLTALEIEQCETRTFELLDRCGLQIDRVPGQTVRTTPSDFEHLYPASGGALYGRSTHGWNASFERPGARSKIPGLYLTGGGTHPGPGLPMVAMSGRLAAESLLQDLGSASRSRGAATPGGTSTP